MEKVNISFNMLQMLRRIGEDLMSKYHIYRYEPEIDGYSDGSNYTVELNVQEVDDHDFIEYMIKSYEDEIAILQSEVE